jgi:hypothetical protein
MLATGEIAQLNPERQRNMKAFVGSLTNELA